MDTKSRVSSYRAAVPGAETDDVIPYEASALIGHSGFVGGNLLRSRSFGARFNSADIEGLAGCSFDTVVCTAAPASMWIANAHPIADARNLSRLTDALESATIRRFILVSTIAVFDDVSAGYTEGNARFETARAYGRHRWQLEDWADKRFDHCHIVRLPALFGPGLKKNFIYDLINAVPSYLADQNFALFRKMVPAAMVHELERLFSFDPTLEKWALDRQLLGRSRLRHQIAQAFEEHGLSARNFTNSASRFQYYDVARLSGDLEHIVGGGLRCLNVCSTPISAAEIAAELTGIDFDNSLGALVSEDVRTDHADLFGSAGPYLFDREAVLAGLRAFFATETAR